jgi:hypothetical protein
VIGEPWFTELMLKTVLKYDFYWNESTLYTRIKALWKHYYMYSTLFISITQSVRFVVTSLNSLPVVLRHPLNRMLQCYKQMATTPKPKAMDQKGLHFFEVRIR